MGGKPTGYNDWVQDSDQYNANGLESITTEATTTRIDQDSAHNEDGVFEQTRHNYGYRSEYRNPVESRQMYYNDNSRGYYDTSGNNATRYGYNRVMKDPGRQRTFDGASVSDSVSRNSYENASAVSEQQEPVINRPASPCNPVEEQITPAYINKLFNATSVIPLFNVNKLISNQPIDSVEDSYYTGDDEQRSVEDAACIPMEDLSK